MGPFKSPALCDLQRPRFRSLERSDRVNLIQAISALWQKKFQRARVDISKNNSCVPASNHELKLYNKYGQFWGDSNHNSTSFRYVEKYGQLFKSPQRLCSHFIVFQPLIHTDVTSLHPNEPNTITIPLFHKASTQYA